MASFVALACFLTAVIVCLLLGLPSKYAFQRADGQTFAFSEVATVREIALSHAYRLAYIKLFIDYDVAPFDNGYQDIFQTADVNSGIRMEFASRTSAIVFAIADPPYGFGVQIHNLLHHDHRQQIVIRAIDGKFIWVDDSEMGRNVIKHPIPHFRFDHILIGQGFDSSRRFSGHIYNVNLSICEYRSYRNWLMLQYSIIFLCLLIGLRCLR